MKTLLEMVNELTEVALTESDLTALVSKYFGMSTAQTTAELAEFLAYHWNSTHFADEVR